MKLLMKGLILTGALAVAPMTYAASYDNCSDKSGCQSEVFAKLNLTAEQKAAIAKIREEYKTKRLEARTATKTAIKSLKEGLANNEATNEELVALHNEVLKARGVAKQLRFSRMLEIRSVLTTEQRTELKSLIRKWHHGKKARRQQQRRQQGGDIEG